MVKLYAFKKNPSPKTQISRTKTCSISPLGIWNMEFGIWDLMDAENYPVYSKV
jgi:hypothetical protein